MKSSPSSLPDIRCRFYKTAAASSDSNAPASCSSLHVTRSASEAALSPSATHLHLPLHRFGSERQGLMPAVPVVPIAAAPRSVSVLCGTWNMHGKPPPPFFPGFADSDATHDIYCFGTQEAGSGIAMSFVMPSKHEWEARLRATLGQTLQATLFQCRCNHVHCSRPLLRDGGIENDAGYPHRRVCARCTGPLLAKRTLLSAPSVFPR
jgi:hypothetical protein